MRVTEVGSKDVVVLLSPVCHKVVVHKFETLWRLVISILRDSGGQGGSACLEQLTETLYGLSDRVIPVLVDANQIGHDYQRRVLIHGRLKDVI